MFSRSDSGRAFRSSVVLKRPVARAEIPTSANQRPAWSCHEPLGQMKTSQISNARNPEKTRSAQGTKTRLLIRQLRYRVLVPSSNLQLNRGPLRSSIAVSNTSDESPPGGPARQSTRPQVTTAVRPLPPMATVARDTAGRPDRRVGARLSRDFPTVDNSNHGRARRRPSRMFMHRRRWGVNALCCWQWVREDAECRTPNARRRGATRRRAGQVFCGLPGRVHRSGLESRVLSADRSQRGADGDDDCPAERYGHERAEEAGAEEPPADPRERQQLEG